jgi:hypothetical protein
MESIIQVLSAMAAVMVLMTPVGGRWEVDTVRQSPCNPAVETCI